MDPKRTIPAPPPGPTTPRQGQPHPHPELPARNVTLGKGLLIHLPQDTTQPEHLFVLARGSGQLGLKQQQLGPPYPTQSLSQGKQPGL